MQLNRKFCFFVIWNKFTLHLMRFSTVYGFNYSQSTLKTFSPCLQFCVFTHRSLCLQRSLESRTMSPKIIQKIQQKIMQLQSTKVTQRVRYRLFFVFGSDAAANEWEQVLWRHNDSESTHTPAQVSLKKGEVKWIKFGWNCVTFLGNWLHLLCTMRRPTGS